MNECGKNIFHSMYERACTPKYVSISKVEELVEKYKYEYEDMQYSMMGLKNRKGVLWILKTLQILTSIVAYNFHRRNKVETKIRKRNIVR